MARAQDEAKEGLPFIDKQWLQPTLKKPSPECEAEHDWLQKGMKCFYESELILPLSLSLSVSLCAPPPSLSLYPCVIKYYLSLCAPVSLSLYPCLSLSLSGGCLSLFVSVSLKKMNQIRLILCGFLSLKIPYRISEVSVFISGQWDS